ncbi:hypothetical protein Poly51_35810 [Rubripirellula tenax]|uniref:Uncharacterized protein n=2 Tax=Rubripirellula TaxID=1579505 RepID=A0A5C6F5V5_9BACT|nr:MULTISPECIES: hypothetical protein [Rubripirellula]TWU51547.1 hypothetical protein Poly59_31390 [Rubripirellula reticaptiva]TWU54861.1 hypothetical protein Poly51_35810 [Rubripirellula tenax]
MTRAYDRRFFAFLAFLFFLAFLGFLGTDNYRHFALLASPAAFASLFFLIFIPRPAERIPERFRLKEQGDIYRALTGRI